MVVPEVASKIPVVLGLCQGESLGDAHTIPKAQGFESNSGGE